MNKAEELLQKGRPGSDDQQSHGYLVDIGHPVFVWLVQPEASAWSLIKKEELGDALCDAQFLEDLLTTR